ncbi:unnamed protein product [Leptidea sinapis]|uniref:Uncharacterized protein n=1 Tax=Leptidea sinapis TaxID=189913 RepID=A0A5E4PUB4_9NEOP|nr:unnamed protein product [Leptidea sinapis]
MRAVSGLVWGAQIRGAVNQILMVILINVPAVSFGLALGWVSLVSGEAGGEGHARAAVVASMSTFAATFLGVPLSAKAITYGRKFAVIATSAGFVVCWSLKLVGGWWMLGGRVAAGLAGASSWVLAPLLARECFGGAWVCQSLTASCLCWFQNHHHFLQLKEMSDRQRRFAFIVGGVAVVGQEVCGVLAIMQYAERLFLLTRDQTEHFAVNSTETAAYAKTADLWLGVHSPSQRAIVLGAVQLVASALSLYLVEKVGRRYRSCALMLVTATASLGNVVEVGILPLVASQCGVVWAVGLAAGFTLAYALFATLAVPETRMRSVEEIYDELCPRVSCGEVTVGEVTIAKCRETVVCTKL